MPRCPFCGTFSYGSTGIYTCECGETLPEKVFDYRRERCICGKSIQFQVERVTPALPAYYRP